MSNILTHISDQTPQFLDFPKSDYCSNLFKRMELRENPISYTDPFGLCPKSIESLSLKDKIKLLGEYGNAYELAEPAFTAYDPNAEPEFKRDTYVDHSRLATLGAMLTPLANETAGNLRVTKFPSFGSNVTSVGNTTLSVWTKDGKNVSYQVSTVTSSEVAEGLVSGSIEGDVSVTFTAVTATESQSKSILEWSPSLVNEALGIEDKRSNIKKVIDEL